MKWTSLFVGLALFFASLGFRPGTAAAEPRMFGLGFVLGDPTGISAKFRFDEPNSIQTHFGFGIGRPESGRVTVVLDYLHKFLNANIESAGTIGPYVGIGGKISVHESDRAQLGVRVPVGAAFYFRSLPIELFAEIALGIHVIPATTVLVDGGLGGRWYF